MNDFIKAAKKLLRIEYGEKPTSESEINNIYKQVFNLSSQDFDKILEEIELENEDIKNKSINKMCKFDFINFTYKELEKLLNWPNINSNYNGILNYQNPIQRKWFINKNETLYFWDSKTQTYTPNWTFQYFLNYSDSFKVTYNLSQEEIDQILKDIKEEQNALQNANNQLSFPNDSNSTIFGIDPGFYNLLKDPKSKSNGNVCKCEMVEYVGLIEKYNHCKKCGKKE